MGSCLLPHQFQGNQHNLKPGNSGSCLLPIPVSRQPNTTSNMVNRVLFITLTSLKAPNRNQVQTFYTPELQALIIFFKLLISICEPILRFRERFQSISLINSVKIWALLLLLSKNNIYRILTENHNAQTNLFLFLWLNAKFIISLDDTTRSRYVQISVPVYYI